MKDPDAFSCLDCDKRFPCPDLPYSDSEPCCPYCDSVEIMEIEQDMVQL
jgi:DNA-directed RNA polymerase subunit RPC12/RpoP